MVQKKQENKKRKQGRSRQDVQQGVPSIHTTRTQDFLFALGETFRDAGEILLDTFIAFMDPRSSRIMRHGGLPRVRDMWAREDARRRKQMISQLKHRKFLETRKVGTRILISLTKKGIAAVMKERIRRAPACKEGECVIIIFDVPETERFVRDEFRRFLKVCRFRQLQLSVWVHDADIIEHVKGFIQYTGGGQWIKVFRATTTHLS